MFQDPLLKNVIPSLPQQALPFGTRGVYTEPFPSHKTRRAESKSVLRARGVTAEQVLKQHQQQNINPQSNPPNNNIVNSSISLKLQQRIYSVLTLTSLCPIPCGESPFNMGYQTLLSSERAFELNSIKARTRKLEEDKSRLESSIHFIESKLYSIATDSKKFETIQNIIGNELWEDPKEQNILLDEEYQNVLEALGRLDQQKNLLKKRLQLLICGLNAVISKLNKAKELTGLFQEEIEQVFQNSFRTMHRVIPWYEGKRNLLEEALSEKKIVSMEEKKSRQFLCAHFMQEVELINKKKSSTPKDLSLESTIDPEVEAELKTIVEMAERAAKLRERQRLKRL